ncbi:MAG: hypothetical protein HY982_00390 [Candidatus Magasanikbacteria bacterium]|nr:hypothetical protein [Candidatus Magasanikbacteria bacterium]
MWWRLVGILSGGMVLTAAETALLPFFPPPFSYGSLSLTFLVLILFLSNRLSSVIFWLLWLGFLHELFSVSPAGAFLFSFLIAFCAAGWLSDYFFTNRTLPALLALGAIASVIFHFSFLVFVAAAGVKYQFSPLFSLKEYVFSFLKELAANEIFLCLFYFLINHFSRRLKSFFLLR